MTLVELLVEDDGGEGGGLGNRGVGAGSHLSEKVSVSGGVGEVEVCLGNGVGRVSIGYDDAVGQLELH